MKAHETQKRTSDTRAFRHSFSGISEDRRCCDSLKIKPCSWWGKTVSAVNLNKTNKRKSTIHIWCATKSIAHWWLLRQHTDDDDALRQASTHNDASALLAHSCFPLESCVPFAKFSIWTFSFSVFCVPFLFFFFPCCCFCRCSLLSCEFQFRKWLSLLRAERQMFWGKHRREMCNTKISYCMFSVSSIRESQAKWLIYGEMRLRTIIPIFPFAVLRAVIWQCNRSTQPRRVYNIQAHKWQFELQRTINRNI